MADMLTDNLDGSEPWHNGAPYVPTTIGHVPKCTQKAREFLKGFPAEERAAALFRESGAKNGGGTPLNGGVRACGQPSSQYTTAAKRGSRVAQARTPPKLPKPAGRAARDPRHAHH